MPTIVGILTFISMVNTLSERLKARNVFIFRYFSFYEQLKVCTQLSWAKEQFYYLGTYVSRTGTCLYNTGAYRTYTGAYIQDKCTQDKCIHDNYPKGKNIQDMPSLSRLYRKVHTDTYTIRHRTCKCRTLYKHTIWHMHTRQVHTE